MRDMLSIGHLDHIEKAFLAVFQTREGSHRIQGKRQRAREIITRTKRNNSQFDLVKSGGERVENTIDCAVTTACEHHVRTRLERGVNQSRNITRGPDLMHGNI